MLVSRNSLWGRLYGKWVELTYGNRRGYKENLCHFVRVCVFWAPWFWFWRQELFRTFVRPWSVIATGFALSILIMFPSFTIAAILYALALAGIILGFTLALYGLGKGAEKLEGVGDAIERSFWKSWRALHVKQAWDWFWKKSYTRFHVRPWLVALLAIQIGSLYWTKWISWGLIRLEVGYFAVSGLFAAVYALHSRNAFKVFAAAGAKLGSATKPVKEPVLGTMGVLVAWLVAQKRKICPYIELV